MNNARYNFFWIYILDLHNNYVEDPRVLKVNPLSPIRLQNILEERIKTSFNKMTIQLYVFYLNKIYLLSD